MTTPKTPNTRHSFDSFDIVLCVALWGGFVYAAWIPAIYLFTLHTLVAITEKDNKTQQ